MVLMPMGQDDCSDIVAILLEEIEVGNANVDPVGGLFWQTHSGVENQHLVTVTPSHATHTEPTDTAERNVLPNRTHLRQCRYSLMSASGSPQTVLLSRAV